MMWSTTSTPLRAPHASPPRAVPYRIVSASPRLHDILEATEKAPTIASAPPEIQASQFGSRGQQRALSGVRRTSSFSRATSSPQQAACAARTRRPTATAQLVIGRHAPQRGPSRSVQPRGRPRPAAVPVSPCDQRASGVQSCGRGKLTGHSRLAGYQGGPAATGIVGLGLRRTSAHQHEAARKHQTAPGVLVTTQPQRGTCGKGPRLRVEQLGRIVHPAIIAFVRAADDQHLAIRKQHAIVLVPSKAHVARAAEGTAGGIVRSPLTHTG